MNKTAIYSLLSADATLTGLVSDRIFPVISERDTALPCVIYRKISRYDQIFPHDGPRRSKKSRIQFDCIAYTSTEAEQVATALIEACQGNRRTVGGTTIWRSEAVNEGEAVELDVGFMVNVDIEFSYKD